jgi:hypothetical protein
VSIVVVENPVAELLVSDQVREDHQAERYYLLVADVAADQVAKVSGQSQFQEICVDVQGLWMSGSGLTHRHEMQVKRDSFSFDAVLVEGAPLEP